MAEVYVRNEDRAVTTTWGVRLGFDLSITGHHARDLVVAQRKLAGE
jgi:hypothetical protein